MHLACNLANEYHSCELMKHRLPQDFHPFHGEQFLSAGMDNTVKIWSFTGEKCLH